MTRTSVNGRNFVIKRKIVCTVSSSLKKMKHKRHQKDKRDKDERGKYHSEISTIYTMKDISPDHNDDSNQPKKLIIYIVNAY